MALQLGDTAPNFTQLSTEGPIDLYQYAGRSWLLLFSHPRDFTPVCTTELGTVARLKPAFERRDVRVVGLSVDPIEDHRGWAADVAETQGTEINFPIVADQDRKVADLYGMIHPNAAADDDHDMTVRSVFVIDPAKMIRLILTYPTSTGRNFEEILRAIDSIQLTDRHKVATPADWRPGEDCIILPSVSDGEARDLFPAGWTALKPYLRLVKDPSARQDEPSPDAGA